MKALNKFRDYQLKNAQILRSSTNSTFIVAPKVVPIQEYHTSQICRECHITISSIRLVRVSVASLAETRSSGVSKVRFGS
jgi:hypothetical protein